ncbi:MAG: hypothetical protein D4R73_01920, partial [Deltaproteobacteria bacterium]
PTSLFQREEKHFPLWKRGIEGDFGSYSALLRHIFQKPNVLRLFKINEVFLFFAGGFGIARNPSPVFPAHQFPAVRMSFQESPSPVRTLQPR